MKPNSFINFFIFLSHLTITANILNYAYDSYGKDSGTRTNFLLYRACSDPNKIFSVPAHKLLYNIRTIILYGYDAIIIGGNLYLYRFMVNFSDKREATLKVDTKKDRRNNLIPAKVGIYAIFTLFFFTIIDSLCYSLDVVNSEERAFFIALTNDICAPALVLYGMPSVRRNIKNSLKESSILMFNVQCFQLR